jgi:FKBP-type peptidyl-prolyl cis-trans isomerase FklB
MKHIFFISALGALVLASCGDSEPAGKLPKTTEDSFSYSIGVNIGQNLKLKGLDKISISGFVKGLRDGMALDSGYAMNEEQMSRIQPDFIAKVQGEKMKVVQAETKEKLTQIAKKKGISLLPSNAYYELLSPGTGATPQATDTIVCRFIMKDANGKVLIDNMKSEEPFKGPLSSLRLAPLEEAFQKTPVGGKFSLYVSNELHPRLVDPNSDFKNKYGITVFEVSFLSLIPSSEKK